MVAPTAPVAPPVPWLFFLMVIAIAIAISVAIGYLGITGAIGAGIPGSRGPSGMLFAGPFGSAVSPAARIPGWGVTA
jgi:hypothetical protein